MRDCVNGLAKNRLESTLTIPKIFYFGLVRMDRTSLACLALILTKSSY